MMKIQQQNRMYGNFSMGFSACQKKQCFFDHDHKALLCDMPKNSGGIFLA